MKEFAAWLKDNHGLRGGSTATTVIGGGSAYDSNLRAAIVEWIKKQ
jgi:hypothetical protein